MSGYVYTMRDEDYRAEAEAITVLDSGFGVLLAATTETPICERFDSRHDWREITATRVVIPTHRILKVVA